VGGAWLVAGVACLGGSGDLFQAVATTADEPGPSAAPDAAAPPALSAPAPGASATGGSTVEAEGDNPALPLEPEPPPREPEPPATPEPIDASTGEPPPVNAAPAEPVVPEATVENPARACPAIEEPLLLDFAQLGSDGASQALFGDFGTSLSGGTFVYPEGGGLDPVTAGLASDVTAGDWHITGLVSGAAGFGLFFNCQLIDARRFSGIAFTLGGNVGVARDVTFLVASASQEVSRDWLVEMGNGAAVSLGRCVPARSQYDGTCQPSRITVRVPAGTTNITVPFSALAGGSPESAVNPAELTSIQWAFPAPDTGGDGVVPYSVDLRIDDIRFVEAP
jgi:hypothetical protein